MFTENIGYDLRNYTAVNLPYCQNSKIKTEVFLKAETIRKNKKARKHKIKAQKKARKLNR